MLTQRKAGLMNYWPEFHPKPQHQARAYSSLGKHDLQSMIPKIL
jgi:hypothetical protein